MAYGLQIFGPTGATWFDSTVAGGGVPVDVFTVPANTQYGSPLTKTYSDLTGYTLDYLVTDNLGAQIDGSFSYPSGVPTGSFYNYDLVTTGTVVVIATSG